MAKTVEIRVPEDEDGSTATVACWLNEVGDEVEENEAVIELETDKVNVEVVAPAEGILVEILVEEGQEVGPGMLLGRIALETVGHEPKTAEVLQVTKAKAPETTKKREVQRGGGSDARLSPVVRRLLREHALDAGSVAGSGSEGRITREDVLDHVARHGRAGRKSAFPKIQAASRTVGHDSMRKKIAEHMVQSLSTAPHVTSVFEMDMGNIIAHRKAHKQAFADKGVNLTFTAYFVAAVVEAIKAVPEVNSSFSEDSLEIFEDMNIGVGTALGDKGLIVPVLHGAQNMDLAAIAGRLGELTVKAREGNLTSAEVRNGTFTISNHGVSGSLIASPIIINQPQSAILGIGKLEKRVVVVEEDGEDVMCIRPRAFVTLSIDHRVLDAWHTNGFLTRFVEVIDNWS